MAFAFDWIAAGLVVGSDFGGPDIDPSSVVFKFEAEVFLGPELAYRSG